MRLRPLSGSYPRCFFLYRRRLLLYYWLVFAVFFSISARAIYCPKATTGIRRGLLLLRHYLVWEFSILQSSSQVFKSVGDTKRSQAVLFGSMITLWMINWVHK